MTAAATFTADDWQNVAETYSEATASLYVTAERDAFASVRAAADAAAADVLHADALRWLHSVQPD